MASKAPKGRVKAGGSNTSAAQRKALFIEAYCTNGGNGKQAAISAGYAPRSAEVTASRLLRQANVRAEVNGRRTQTLKKAEALTEVTAAEVLRSCARAIRFDPRKLYNQDGSLKRLLDLDDDTADAITGFDVVEMAGGEVPTYTKKVKWIDKNTARDQLMKHFGLYEADNDQKPQTTIHLAGVKSVKFEPLKARKAA